MSELRTLYNELLSDLYPYDEPQGNETPREMLYNLVCIASRNFTPLDQNDTKFLNRINTLIDLFAHLLVELRESVRMNGAVRRIEREVKA